MVLSQAYSQSELEDFFRSDSNTGNQKDSNQNNQSKHFFVTKENQTANAYELNHNNYFHFFANFRCIKDQILPKPGFIALHHKQTMHLWVTDTFKETDWAKILDLAKTNQTYLNLTFKSVHAIPASMKSRLTISPLSDSALQNHLSPHQIILSNDLDFSEIQFLQGIEYLDLWAEQAGVLYLDEFNLNPTGSLDCLLGLFNGYCRLGLNVFNHWSFFAFS